MNDIYSVKLTRNVLKNLKKVPTYVVIKLQAWIDNVGHLGLMTTRKIKGYHDEQLKGKRTGQRSIRLSRSYRAIYVVNYNDKIRFVEIFEVNKHEY